MRFFTDDKADERNKGQRPLEVIAAGLPRCATSSLQAALETTLGFSPSMHMARVVPHADRAQLVIDALREKDRNRRQKLLHQLFDGFAATCDFPGVMFIDDLMDMYPDAKVVLNQRKSGKVWADSISSSLMFFGTKTYLAIGFLIKTDRLHYEMHQQAYKLWLERFGVERTQPFTPEFYNLYNQWVRDEAAKRGRPVLEFHIEGGWKSLCPFLGKPLPPVDVPFPHLNDQRTMAIVKTVVIVRGLLSWAALGGALYAGIRFGRGWFM
jgi:hypothetical protein